MTWSVVMTMNQLWCIKSYLVLASIAVVARKASAYSLAVVAQASS